jgi:hypothetical protein
VIIAEHYRIVLADVLREIGRVEALDRRRRRRKRDGVRYNIQLAAQYLCIVELKVRDCDRAGEIAGSVDFADTRLPK